MRVGAEASPSKGGVQTRSSAKRSLAMTTGGNDERTGKTPSSKTLASPLLDSYFQPKKLQRVHGPRQQHRSESLRAVRSRGGVKEAERPQLSGHFAMLPQVRRSARLSNIMCVSYTQE